jgi:hypothetical protein
MMDITAIPFNRFIKLARPDGDADFVLQLEDSTDYENHLGTVHASAQLALAEATSGELLMQRFPELGKNVLAVVRRLEAKFRKPLKGKVLSKGTIPQEAAEKLIEQLQTKGRGSISVEVEIIGTDGATGLSCTIEWFAQRQK